ncbi:MAG: UDP-N-acetylmuramate--L-alanine ligase [Bdellovibrionales bacterium]|nr:UDP-N-acetylmuramate--L-alanine ligase [Bdellovibrionales bacterium]
MKLSEAKAHFIGAGGVGMSALAELFHMMGAKVSGSDIKKSKYTDYLEKLGVEIFIGHAEENVSDVDVVVYSSAIDEGNPEVQKARRGSIPIIPRAEALAEVMSYKRGIAVGGTHGKTSTTSMISSIFLAAKKDPTIAVGGRLQLIESTARLGKGPWMVAEADESDGSFLRLRPEISIITNIDSDHLDHYGTFENLQRAFRNFALNVPFYGAVVVNGDDPATRLIFRNFPKRIFFYGMNDNNDFVLKKNGKAFDVHHNKEVIGTIDLQVPGIHNALNALAACIASHQTGLDWPTCFDGVNAYTGVDRRFQPIGEAVGVKVFDDYAHHPTEIRATLQGARERYGKGKVHVIYQPHRYSRTEECWNEYKDCFNDLDELYLVDIYPAGETPVKGIDSQTLSREIQASSVYCMSFEDAVDKVSVNVKEGDVVLTMGAGHIWQCAGMLVDKLNG